MNQELKNYPKIQGLSKNKIIFFISMGLAVILVLMLFGVFNLTPDNDKNKSDDTAIKYDHSDNNSSINQILHTVNENKAKLATSEPMATRNAASSTLIITIPPIAKKTKIIPLQDQDTDTNTALGKYKQGLEVKKYDSYSAKSLIFSKPLTLDSNLDKNASNLASSNTEGTANSHKIDAVNGSGVSVGTSNAFSGAKFVGGSNADNQNQNQQDEKKSFLKNIDDSNSDYLSSRLTSAISPYEVKAGSVIPAAMISGLNSDLPGQIVAMVRDNVYDSLTRQYLLIPQGTKLIGLYDSNIAYGQERVLVIWNRLIYPNGDSINLKGMPGTDLEGYAGFHDIVDNKYWKLFGTSFVMGVITGAMQYSQNNTNPNVQVGGLGVTSTNPTIGQTMAGSLGQQLGQTGLSIAQKNLNVQPTLIIRPGYLFNVMLTADIILKPYSLGN